MTNRRFRQSVVSVLTLAILVAEHGCGDPVISETINVSLTNTETYRHPTVGGDEEGARISTQASHSSISEIQRNAETNWVAVYVYRAAPGFVGPDYAEVEILTGSDGSTSPTKARKVAFHFVVR